MNKKPHHEHSEALTTPTPLPGCRWNWIVAYIPLGLDPRRQAIAHCRQTCRFPACFLTHCDVLLRDQFIRAVFIASDEIHGFWCRFSDATRLILPRVRLIQAAARGINGACRGRCPCVAPRIQLGWHTIRSIDWSHRSWKKVTGSVRYAYFAWRWMYGKTIE